MRDNFTDATISKLAKKAGWLCSRPGCGISTVGASQDGTRIINRGIAAHITAASPGGPRYDPKLSHEERRHENNGIWLCANDATVIDDDEDAFPVMLLQKWKRYGELRSFHALSQMLTSAQPVDIAIERSSLDQFALAADESLELITEQLLEASKRDIETFKTSPNWPLEPVILDLKLIDNDDDDKVAKPFNVEGLANVAKEFNELTIFAPPGTGKSTTLIQFSSCLVSQQQMVVGLILLNEWASAENSLLETLLNRLSFQRFQLKHFQLLASYGRLVLILDGWNEISLLSKNRLKAQILQLKRDFPELHLIVSSRQEEYDIPLSGPTIKLEALDEAKQLHIAQSLRGEEGKLLLEQAWRTAGICELVRIPFYLVALLSQTSGDKLPTTKEAIIRLFVENQEQDPIKGETLRQELFNLHTRILMALAVKMTTEESTSLSETDARKVIKITIDELVTEGQLAVPQEPAKIINLLLSLHLLIASNSQEKSVSFQHQQFQEWYASLYVAELMQGLPDLTKLQLLKRNVLNEPMWKEAVLFAVERLSNGSMENSKAVAESIFEAIRIEPLFAASMIYRASNNCWCTIKNRVLEFISKWHTPATVDRAVRFMLITGKPEFSEYIWALLSDEEVRLQLRIFHTNGKIRTSVLGSNIEQRISALNHHLRRQIIREIAFESDLEGLELAASLAIADSSNDIKNEIIDILLFRRAHRLAVKILKNSPDEVWQQAARRRTQEEIENSECIKRLTAEYQSFISKPENEILYLHHLLDQIPEDGSLKIPALQLIEKVDSEKHKDSINYAFERAYSLCPEETVQAFFNRISDGKTLPYWVNNILEKSPLCIDDGPTAESILDGAKIRGDRYQIALTIGSDTIEKLIDKYVMAYKSLQGDTSDVKKREKHDYVFDAVTHTRVPYRVQAILNRPLTDDPLEISLLAGLVYRQTPSSEKLPLVNQLEDETYDKLVNLIIHWGESLLKSTQTKRHQSADLVNAIEQVASPKLLDILYKMNEEELRKRPLSDNPRMFYTNQYRAAYAAIGNEKTIAILKSYLSNLEFGHDAAIALRIIWARANNIVIQRRWPDFSMVRTKRLERENNSIQTEPFVTDILQVIESFIGPANTEEEYKHALKLAEAALFMPYANAKSTIDRLLDLPLPIASKKGLLTILAVSGEILNSEMIIQGIDELLECGKEPNTRWRLYEQNAYALREWLILLPFSDKPMELLSIIKRIEEYDPKLLAPYHLDNLYAAISNMPTDDSLSILMGMANISNKFFQEDAWLHSLYELDNVDAGMFLLKCVLEHKFIDENGKNKLREISDELAQAIMDFSDVRQTVYETYPKLPSDQSKSILETAISKSADIEGILLLFKSYVEKQLLFRHTSLPTAIREYILVKTPSPDSVNTYMVSCLSSQPLRKTLFDIYNANLGFESELAEQCLVYIDDLRDEYGEGELEPRHPDLDSGVPWPRIELK